MTARGDPRWIAETAAFVRQFTERAARWDEHSGDLEDAATATGPDHPDDRVEPADRSGTVRLDRRGDALPLGPDADRELMVTFFPDKHAFRKTEVGVSLANLADRIRTIHAPRKEALPLIKLARFGAGRTKNGCCRFDANVLQITGVEGDYDGERIGFDRAVEIAEKIGLRSIVYTSPSYTPAKPRWRVMAPASRALGREQRAQLMDRLNGAYEGVFHAESWTLSQGFYIGYVAPDGGPNPHHRVELIGGTAIDELDELDAIAIGRQGSGSRSAGDTGSIGSEPRGDAELIVAIVTGEHYHNELLALAARYIGRGMLPQGVADTLWGMMLAVPEARRDDRWPDRFASIGQIVASAGQKFVAGAGRRRAIARVTHRLADSRRPAGEIISSVRAEAQNQGLPPDDALAIASAILRDKVTGDV